jgi:hypothetical protein
MEELGKELGKYWLRGGGGDFGTRHAPCLALHGVTLREAWPFATRSLAVMLCAWRFVSVKRDNGRSHEVCGPRRGTAGGPGVAGGAH